MINVFNDRYLVFFEYKYKKNIGQHLLKKKQIGKS